MTSIIKLNAISGAMDESPPCYVLQVDEFRFLLDCGWDEKFDMDFIKEFKRHVNSIDAVLISYPDPLHLGGLPYAVGKLGLNCPIYVTLPVYKMGQMFLYDLYQSRYNMEDFDLFSLDDVDTAFDKMTQLKYNQSVAMKGKGFGLTITPLPAGHMIGGTIWKIAKEGEEDIIYATDFNHKKERHLNGCDLEKLLRPSVLITDALNANYQQARRRTRDEKFMTTILGTLRGGGSVLVCVDTAGRVLELAHMLDQLWRNKDSGLIAYSLVLLNNVSYNVVEFAKSMIEWMSDKLMRNFEDARNNPFQLKYLQLCHSIIEVQRIPGPKVVLASSPDLDSGFSRDLFLMWATQPQNSIVLTTRTSPGTLARDLLDNGGNRTIDLSVKRRVKLEGAELDEYIRNHRVKVEIKKEEDVGVSSDSDSDDDLEISIITGKHDIIVKNEINKTTGFFKSNKKQHAMFPYHEEKTKSDEYGEIIRPEDYRLAEVMEVEGEIKEVAPAPPKKEYDLEDPIDIPTKCIVSKKSINVKAAIQYIDFEGRSDGESLLKIVSQMKARSVICLRGNEKSVTKLRNHCVSEGCGNVYTPLKGELVDATTESHIYQVHLTDALMSSLLWQKSGDNGAEVAWLQAKVGVRESEPRTARALPMDIDRQRHENNNLDEEQIFTLEPLLDDEITPHNAIFINELKLSDFKQSLSKHGVSSEFVGGILWCCNGTLAVKRLETGRVSLEGVLSEEYYKVRDLLYDQYAIV